MTANSNISQDKKVTLDSLPKEQIFTTPTHYFNDLSSTINERVHPQKQRFDIAALFAQYKLAYALPAMLLAIVFIFVLNQNSTSLNSSELLSSISTTTLVDYLEESDLSEVDIIESSALAYEYELESLSIEDELLLDEFSVNDFEDFI